MKSGFTALGYLRMLLNIFEELLNFSLRGCLHDTGTLYGFHSDASSSQFPLASLYLLHDYSKKSRNTASHTWVSSYRYHVNMAKLFDSFCIKVVLEARVTLFKSIDFKGA